MQKNKKFIQRENGDWFIVESLRSDNTIMRHLSIADRSLVLKDYYQTSCHPYLFNTDK